ncbi:MAG: cytochrome c3 family protein, partial [Bradymonadaceae bacterium]
LHPVVIKTPEGIGTLRTDLRDIHDKGIGVACSTCHAETADHPLIEHTDDLEAFHTDIEVAHGELSCSSCHHPDDRDSLRLADGQKRAFAETTQLCAQCHGTQFRSYENGAHGGMVGHWDLSQGGRERNDCVVCHDPHSPAYPQVMPAAPPRDRFFNLKDK